MNYQTILFDLDGTLIDTKPGVFKSLKTTLAALDITPPSDEKLTLFLGPPLRECFMQVIGLTPELTDRAVSIFRRDLMASGNAFDCRVFDGIPQLLGQLKKAGFKLGVATSKVTYLAELVLDKMEIRNYFDAIEGAPTDQPGASKADSIRRAIAGIAVAEPRTTVLVGDRCYDAQGAVQAGVESIGVFYGYGSPEEIQANPFTYTVPTVRALEKFLLG